MLWIVGFFILLLLVGMLIAAVDEDTGIPLCILSGAVLFICFLSTIITYSDHAHDLGTIRGQEKVISVYEEKSDRLRSVLGTFEYPMQRSQVVLNADSPIASTIAALTEAEKSLARAKERKAEAMVSIERRRAGLMSFIVTLAGDK